MGVFIVFTAPSISEQSKLHLFFSLDGLSFLVTYLATSYRFGSENIFLSKIVGSITLGICAYLTYYFLKINGENFPDIPATEARLVSPDGISGRMFLVYTNYKNLLYYNCSSYYAVAIGLLSDEIIK